MPGKLACTGVVYYCVPELYVTKAYFVVCKWLLNKTTEHVCKEMAISSYLETFVLEIMYDISQQKC